MFEVPEAAADDPACKAGHSRPSAGVVHVVTAAARAPSASLPGWLRHPCPRNHDEQGGQDEGTEEDPGRHRKYPRPVRHSAIR